MALKEANVVRSYVCATSADKHSSEKMCHSSLQLLSRQVQIFSLKVKIWTCLTQVLKLGLCGIGGGGGGIKDIKDLKGQKYEMKAF